MNNEFIRNEPGPNEKVLSLKYIPTDFDKDANGVTHPYFPDYLVYRNGTVIRKDNGFIINPIYNKPGPKHKTGYAHLRLRNKHNQVITVNHHRLVLSAYRPIEMSQLYYVNHRDMNGHNNRLDNLEWITHGQNNQYSRKTQFQEHMDWNKPVGVIIHNVFTDEIREYTRIDECASFLGLQRDDVIHRLNVHDIGKIWPDGWRFKRRQDIREWPEVTKDDILNISSGKARPLLFRWMKTGETIESESINKLAPQVGVGVPALWLQVESNQDEIKANVVQGKSIEHLYQIKYKFDDKPWKEYPTLWHAYADAREQARPVLVITPDGKEEIFPTGREAARKHKQLFTTLCYRLQRNSNKPANDGNVYRYYLDWYNEQLNEK